jgi:hypothetical protein
LTARELVQSADAICREVMFGFAALEVGPTDEPSATFVEAILDGGREGVRRLAELRPPRLLQHHYDRFVSVLEARNESTAWILARARAHAAPGAVERRRNRQTGRAFKRAQRLGLSQCPFP